MQTKEARPKDGEVESRHRHERKRFFQRNALEGENRFLSTSFPERVDDYVEEGSVVRVIDVFIDRPDIFGLGLKTEAADTGRPGYHPRTMLKITCTVICIECILHDDWTRSTPQVMQGANLVDADASRRLSSCFP